MHRFILDKVLNLHDSARQEKFVQNRARTIRARLHDKIFRTILNPAPEYVSLGHKFTSIWK